MKQFSRIMVLIVSIFLVSCASSRLYQPVSAWEVRERDKIKENISLTTFQETKKGGAFVVWTGLIRSISISEDSDSKTLHILVEQRFYDWVEDFGMQPQRFFISKRSTGNFTTEWKVKKSADDNQFKKQIGDMVVVYGVPEITESMDVHVDSTYVRLIPINLVLEMEDFFPSSKYQ